MKLLVPKQFLLNGIATTSCRNPYTILQATVTVRIRRPFSASSPARVQNRIYDP
jgi:hypothetical protein